MPHISHKCKLFHVHIGHIYASIYASYQPTTINNLSINSGIHTLYWHMPLDKDACHTVHMFQGTNTVVYITAQNKLQLLFTCFCHTCANNKYAPLNATHMPHMPITSRVDIRQICQYIYLIRTHCNQQCEHKHWYTHISHHWHMALNINTCHITHVCPIPPVI